MTAPALDLLAYLDRIRWRGERRPTMDTLRSILAAHMAQIPFENMDVLLGRGVRIDLGSLQAKLVHGRRGGYCYEHATLLHAALEQIGFSLQRHSARVVVLTPRTESTRTHMFLTVTLREGTFVLDPGFGGLAPRVPVPLSEGAVGEIDHEKHWLVKDGAYWVLRTDVGERKGGDAWASTLEPDNPIDFEMANHYTSTYPTSPFVNRLALRALTANGRVTVMNRDAALWEGGEKRRAWQLADRRELRGLLAEHFGFDLPEVESMRVPMVPEWQ
jgi:N-hydroxyarylamine O-acetyltransferase